jgi:hypothetical protein
MEKMKEMKEKLTEVCLTFRKVATQLPEFNATEEPETHLELIHEEWRF